MSLPETAQMDLTSCTNPIQSSNYPGCCSKRSTKKPDCSFPDPATSWHLQFLEAGSLSAITIAVGVAASDRSPPPYIVDRRLRAHSIQIRLNQSMTGFRIARGCLTVGNRAGSNRRNFM